MGEIVVSFRIDKKYYDMIKKKHKNPTTWIKKIVIENIDKVEGWTF